MAVGVALGEISREDGARGVRGVLGSARSARILLPAEGKSALPSSSSASSSSLDRFLCLMGELDSGGTAATDGENVVSYEPSRLIRLGGVRDRSDPASASVVDVDSDRASDSVSASRSEDGRFRGVVGGMGAGDSGIEIGVSSPHSDSPSSNSSSDSSRSSSSSSISST